MAVPLRKRVRRAARSLAIAVLIRCLAGLPLRAAFALARWVGAAAWVLAREQRRLMLEHLALALPERTAAEREAIARQSLVHLAQVALELVTARRNLPRIADYVSLPSAAAEVIRRAAARGKGVVFVAGHIGNWELLAWRLAGVVRPGAVIARRNSDERLNRAVEGFRQAGGYATLWREAPSTGREMIKLFRQGGGLGILIDQDTRVQGVFVPFFGRLAFTPRAVGDLALRFGAAVVVVTSRRRGPNPGDGHELGAVELAYDPAPADREAEVVRLTAAAVRVQEEAIRRNPVEWVWMHRRWKTQPTPEVCLARQVPKSRELSET